MILVLLGKLFKISDLKSFIKIIIGGLILYLLIGICLYSKFSNKLQGLSKYRIYIFYILVGDITMYLLMNRNILLENKPNNYYIENNVLDSVEKSVSEDDDELFQSNLYNKNNEYVKNMYKSPFKKLYESESDIELPVYNNN
jgi:hypothetical protein